MKIAVVTGKNLSMSEQEPTQLFIFDLVQGDDQNTLHDDKFIESHRVNITSIPGFEKFCMKFKFKTNEANELVFVDQSKIFEFNYETHSIKSIATFPERLSR